MLNFRKRFKRCIRSRYIFCFFITLCCFCISVICRCRLSTFYKRNKIFLSDTVHSRKPILCAIQHAVKVEIVTYSKIDVLFLNVFLNGSAFSCFLSIWLRNRLWTAFNSLYTHIKYTEVRKCISQFFAYVFILYSNINQTISENCDKSRNLI